MSRWFVFLLVTGGLIGQIPAEWRLVSVADHAELYEIDKSGELTFTLRNRMDLQLDSYALEVWTRDPRGQFSRWCSIRETHAAIGVEPRALAQHCQLPIDQRTGKAVFHSSRIVELDWERGVRWRPALTIAAHPRS